MLRLVCLGRHLTRFSRQTSVFGTIASMDCEAGSNSMRAVVVSAPGGPEVMVRQLPHTPLRLHSLIDCMLFSPSFVTLLFYLILLTVS